MAMAEAAGKEQLDEEELAFQCEAMAYEYETQFYGFSSKAFCDNMFNILVDKMETSLVELAKEAKKKEDPNISEENLADYVEKFQKEMQDHMERLMGQFEMYVTKKLLKIPVHVLLPEDQVHRNEPTEQEMKQLHQNILKLQKRRLQEVLIKQKLREELGTSDALIKELEAALEMKRQAESCGGQRNHGSSLSTNP